MTYIEHFMLTHSGLSKEQAVTVLCVNEFYANNGLCPENKDIGMTLPCQYCWEKEKNESD